MEDPRVSSRTRQNLPRRRAEMSEMSLSRRVQAPGSQCHQPASSGTNGVSTREPGSLNNPRFHKTPAAAIAGLPRVRGRTTPAPRTRLRSKSHDLPGGPPQIGSQWALNRLTVCPAGDPTVRVERGHRNCGWTHQRDPPLGMRCWKKIQY